MRVLPAEERKHSFDEVALGLTDEQARREASRCLECGCLDYYRCKLINYANKYNAEFERFAGQKSPAKKTPGTNTFCATRANAFSAGFACVYARRSWESVR